MLLKELVSSISIKKVNGDVDIDIKNIQTDSRKVSEGELFIAIAGHTVDGHDFIEQAIKNGASAILSEKEMNGFPGVPFVIVNDTRRAMALVSSCFFSNPSKDMTMIGITGTNGKTTTTNLIDHIFTKVGFKTGLIGTIHNKIGDTFEEAINTTPESLELQRLLYRMKQKNVTHVIMEVSSHSLVEGRVHGVDFDSALFTNLTQDHLDFHRTMEEYKQAKSLLFSQMGNDLTKMKISILNNDDDASDYYRMVSPCNVVTYGIHASSDFQATDIKIKPNGTSFSLTSPYGTHEIQTKLIGKFNVYNILAAIATCVTRGIDILEVISAIQNVKGVNGRFEPIDLGQNFSTIIDFAHTPDSLENVLSTISDFSTGSIYTIVGCGGDRDKTKRPIMASIAEKYSDFVILTSDNPRSENPTSILDDMEKGLKRTNYKKIIDRKEAIQYGITSANKNDVVLIAGKGHETYQIIGNEKMYFSDKETATQFIKDKFNK